MSSLLKQYSWLFDLIAVLLCSFFLANIVGVYLGDVLEFKRSIAVLNKPELETEKKAKPEFTAYEIIVERNIFDSTATKPDESNQADNIDKEPMITTGEAVKTSLDIKVIGVLVVGDGRDSRSSATIVAGGKGDAQVYAVGAVESFAPNTRLTLVSPSRIEFLNNNRLEYAEVGLEEGVSIFGPPPVGEKVAEATKPSEHGDSKHLINFEGSGKYTIDQAEVANALNNLDKLYTDIRAVPNFANGKVSGMKILSVRSGSLFSKLGLQRGDILQRINGIELDVRKGFEIFNQLKDQKSLTVDLIRQGSNQTFEYEIR
ncbi:MAG: hypothetical protein COS89_06830 [Deltaproteobacteria bacterium CG07_land_8_20_14_0_80_38_7]|nr:MAG: hypothetical protein COS89_06830 [Deltaproteobacteria bacterium CG07_land_8_20_14_0_80_38_7]